jgi:hypothetical protein
MPYINDPINKSDNKLVRNLGPTSDAPNNPRKAATAMPIISNLFVFGNGSGLSKFFRR